VKAKCAYCGGRAYAALTGLDATGRFGPVCVCPQCVPVVAAWLQPGTVHLTYLPDHRTIGWAIRRALLWAAIIMAVPFVAGMIYAALEMISGR
jgi:hypothetical protein